MRNSFLGGEFITVKELTLFESFQAHTHKTPMGDDALELCYVLDGELYNVTDEGRKKLTRGDYLLIDYGVAHSYEVEEGHRPRILNFLFDHRAFDVSFKGVKSLAEVAYRYGVNNSRDDLFIGYDYYFSDEDGKVRGILKELKAELINKSGGYHEISRCLLISVILLSLRRHFGREVNSEYSPGVERVVRAVNDGYMQDLTLSELARLEGQKLAALSIAFKRESGDTFTDFLHKRRIKESCRLLLSTDYSVEQISELVGYSDSGKFRERFRRYEGMSPREYRKRMGF